MLKDEEYKRLVGERDNIKKLLDKPTKHAKVLSTRLGVIRDLLKDHHRTAYKNENNIK